MRALILCVVEVRRRLGVIPDSSLMVIKILFIFLWCSKNNFRFLFEIGCGGLDVL